MNREVRYDLSVAKKNKKTHTSVYDGFTLANRTEVRRQSKNKA